MKVTFDWKNFEFEKPEKNRKLVVIFTNRDGMDAKNFVLCVYTGHEIEKIGKNQTLVHHFSGREVKTRSLTKDVTLSYPIYDPKDYTNNFNPYNFFWDYYDFNIDIKKDIRRKKLKILNKQNDKPTL